MTKGKKKVPTPQERKEMAERYLEKVEKEGDLRPDHDRSFDDMLSDIAPPIKKPER